jgi:general secretion pathway protein A
MYTKYFGFNEKPFTLTPNPRFIYLSKNHKEAFAHLLYGINNHYGFIELIGEVGTGKTTVLRTLLNQLQEENYRTALIVNPCLTGVELLRSICHEFGLSSKSEYANELLIEINKFLLQETAENRTVVLVIDESQNLQPAVLEQIRLISNLETENDKLIQIILAGQPELGALLERPELRQLNQRIAVRYRLKSMSMPETRAYIRHRMEVAGDSGAVSFSPFVIRLIYLYTRGVPRMINILCDRALLIGYGNERKRITTGVITTAIKELQSIPHGKRFSLTLVGLICIAIFCVVLLFNLSKWTPGQQNSKISSPMSSENTASGAQAPVSRQALIPALKTTATMPTKIVDEQFLRLQREMLSYNQNNSHLLAFNAIAGKWGVSPIKRLDGQLTVPNMFSRLAAKRNMRVTEFKGSLDDVIRFDVPFLVKTRIIGSMNEYCIAVTSIRKDSVSISPALFKSSTLAKKDLNMIASGTFYLVWQNSGQIPDKLKQGDKRFEIRNLQLLLQKAGTYKDLIDGNYSVATIKAVRDFQQSAGITRDENVGELTLAALEKYYTNVKVPSISSTEGSK